jgi:hypothetical protein
MSEGVVGDTLAGRCWGRLRIPAASVTIPTKVLSAWNRDR